MTIFLVIGGLLIAASLLYVVPPLLHVRNQAMVSRRAANVSVYRDQLKELEADRISGTLSADQYDQACRELEGMLLLDAGADEPKRPQQRGSLLSAVVLIVVVPVAAAVVYVSVGTPKALLEQAQQVAQGSQAAQAKQVSAMVASLEERLKANPEDGEGWVMLARSYSVLAQYKRAASAYANAAQRLPANAAVLVDYADTLAVAQGRKLQGEPEALIARALKIDPRNIKALALAGTVAFEKNDYPNAISHWERALALLPPESRAARSLQGSIGEARTLAGRALGGTGGLGPLALGGNTATTRSAQGVSQ